MQLNHAVHKEGPKTDSGCCLVVLEFQGFEAYTHLEKWFLNF